MTRHPNHRHGTKPLPKRTAAILADAGERMKIRMLLSNGATATPIGPVTYLRMVGSDLVQTFPTEMVEAIMRDRMAIADCVEAAEADGGEKA